MSIEFLDKYTKENNFGILLDISHTRIIYYALVEEKLIDLSLEEFFLEYVKVLGDRILSKQINGNDGRKHIVGRYL